VTNNIINLIKTKKRMKINPALYLAIGMALLLVSLPESQVRAQEGMSIIVPTGRANLILQPDSSQSLISSTGSATSNVTFNITVTDSLVGGKPEGSDGVMAEWDNSSYVIGGKKLTNAVKVWSDMPIYNQGIITLNDSTQDVIHAVPAGTDINLQLNVTQDTVSGDETLSGGHWYRIIITFTIVQGT
jgi:hypothetical protein